LHNSFVKSGGRWAQNKHVEALGIATGEADLIKNMLYKANKISHTQLHNTKVRKAVGKLENTHENGSSPAAIAVLQDELKDLAARREDYARDSGFTTMTARNEGGKEMVTVLKGASKTNNGLELLDEVQFIFHQALKQFSRAINRQHGTNGHGINALAKQHEIHRMFML
jgi:hypothetical protein